MYVVICGGGLVGSFLAGNLTRKGHSVVVIEKNEAVCERIAAETRALVIRGDGCDVRFQTEARSIGRTCWRRLPATMTITWWPAR